MKSPFTREFDWKLLLLWILLMLLGVIAIYSASTLTVDSGYIRSDFYWKQAIFVLLSFVILFVIMKIPSTILDVFVYPGLIITLILLVSVFFMPPINNAHRWVSIGGLRIQPSEMAKIVLILVNARLMAKNNISKLRMLLLPFAYILIPLVLIIRQPDLGTSMILFISYVVMLVQAGFPLFILFLLMTPIISIIASFYIPAFIVFALILVFLLIRQRFSTPFIIFVMVINLFFLFITPVIWNSLKSYQQNRILTFIDPTRDPLNAGYQVIQARIAVGSGQLFGKGFLEGTQKNMNFLPEQHTDFIFSVISEEFGFVGSTFLLLIFLLFFIRIVKNIFRSEIKERRIAMAGIFGFLFFQVAINVGMNIGLMPTTGIPLPFISYGGSNLLVNAVAISLVLKYSQEKDV